MAKTTKKIKENVVVEEFKTLSQDHLRKLETGSRDVDNAKLLMAIEEQSLVNTILKSELITLAMAKQREIVKSKAAEYELAKKRYETLKKEVFVTYSLPGDNFGYDTDTGRIV